MARSQYRLPADVVSSIKEMFKRGHTYGDISKALGVSTSTVYAYSKEVKRECTPPTDIPGEEWREVPGFDGKYIVSNMGRVFATGGGSKRRCGLVRPSISGKGYLGVALSKNSSPVNLKVHRLVAEAFVPGKSDVHNQVNHIDGNKTNNCADNLEWVSQSENMLHAYRMLGKVPARAHNCALTDEQVRLIRSDSRSAKSLARLLGVGKTTVLNVRHGRTYRHVK